MHEVHGAIHDKYESMGGTGSALGFPTSDERSANTSPSGTTGRVNDFEGGHIHSSGKGTFATSGVIDQKYKDSGGSGGPYGFPTSDPYDGTCGKQQNFEGGTIIGNPDTSAPAISPPVAAPGCYKSPQTVAWSVADVGCSGLASATFAWDNDAFHDGTTTTIPDAEGDHALHIRAKDNAANEVNQDFTYSIDKTAPTITLMEAPAANACVAAGRICWKVTDAGCVGGSVTYSLDGAAPVAVNATDCLDIATEGIHNLALKAVDAAGNIREQAVGPLTVDAIPPNAPTRFSVTPGHYSAWLTWRAPVESGCVAVAGYYVYRRVGQTYQKLNKNEAVLARTNFRDAGLNNGEVYGYAVAAVDALGREGAKAELTGIVIGLRGDLNADGVLDISDVIICINIIQSPANYTAAQKKAADYDRDGNVDAADVTAMKNAILGK